MTGFEFKILNISKLNEPIWEFISCSFPCESAFSLYILLEEKESTWPVENPKLPIQNRMGQIRQKPLAKQIAGSAICLWRRSSWMPPQSLVFTKRLHYPYLCRVLFIIIRPKLLYRVWFTNWLPAHKGAAEDHYGSISVFILTQIVNPPPL